MAGVFYCSQTNSTTFTECCQVAVCDDQSDCPACGEPVWPQSALGRHDAAMKKMYGHKQVAEMRAKWRRADAADGAQ